MQECKSQSASASVKNAHVPKHGRLQKFYNMLDRKQYDKLEKSLQEFSCCAVGTKLGLEDTDSAGTIIIEYDRDLWKSGCQVYRMADRLKDGLAEPGDVKALGEHLDRIAGHEIDHKRLSEIRSFMEGATRDV